MADVPPEMKRNSRPVDPVFADDEDLFRRFAPDNLDGDEISIAAVGLPDMSVHRGKYGPPGWLLLAEEFSDWGVLSFKVRDIPPNREIFHLGNIPYVLMARHVPYNLNYPHSEVHVYLRNEHICRENDNLDLLDPDFHLRWRECIVFASHVVVHPAGPG